MAKILVVDDSSMARRSTRKLIEAAGYAVSDAEDGLAALERYFLEKPDVVLLDVTMKHMDGLEVLKKIRELDPNARVVIVTADVQSSTRQMAQDGGACAFVIKPIATESLLDAVRTALQRGTPCT
jgi:two-component system chemotaxis response regulator CheY